MALFGSTDQSGALHLLHSPIYTHIHTLMAMRGANLKPLIRRDTALSKAMEQPSEAIWGNLGFSILTKGTLICRRGIWGIESPAFSLGDVPLRFLSHNNPKLPQLSQRMSTLSSE